MMAGSYSNLAKDVDKRVGALFKAAPKQMGAYGQLAQVASSDGPIEAKIKELMARAISITVKREDRTSPKLVDTFNMPR
ncbi:MAG: hypothetical protein H6905_11270 [Hyphomicrobiales bacterium]|nr:hypothetical protein [Hyphomicrobiales bacterium]